jgi:hypothetical protein
MIITKLMGGLGNQMFQYATGRRLAYVHGVKLYLDTTWFKDTNLRNYLLNCFNIKNYIATPKQISKLKLKKNGFRQKILTIFFKKSTEFSSTHIVEKFFHFNSELMNLPDHVYLDGYWQSEKYFQDIEDILRNEFTVKRPQSGKNLELSEMIESCESVSIHFRRGDYITDPQTIKIHGACDIEYYNKSVQLVAKHLKNPKFFIFSDDSNWVNENLKLNYPTTLVSHNQDVECFEDLRLMSQCKYNIIANSSFSWWGAWLNNKADKIVIAPKRWFRTEERDTRDLLPKSWIRI